LRAGPILAQRAMSNPKIKFIWNSVVSRIVGEEAVRAVALKNVVTGEEQEMNIDGVFVFIGHTPNTQLFEGHLEMDSQGFLKINQLMQTNIPGVFAAGEAADPHFKQVITSAGMGAAAAIEANRYLDKMSPS
jgi:thioredoxin reductase (NADPH)